jgi:hypothetical protein
MTRLRNAKLAGKIAKKPIYILTSRLLPTIRSVHTVEQTSRLGTLNKIMIRLRLAHTASFGKQRYNS